MSQRENRNRQRQFDREMGRRCLARGSHDDAVALAEYMLARGGQADKPAEQIALDLKWEQRLGGMRQTDMGRFQRARNHLKDGRAKDGKPCTGYSLHYRTSGKGSVWKLIDPAGGLQHHMDAAIEEIRGDIQQQVSFRTVNGRRISTAEQMAEWCLKAETPDGRGHRLMLEYSIELRKFGAVSDGLIAEINLWLAGVAA